MTNKKAIRPVICEKRKQKGLVNRDDSTVKLVKRLC